MDPTITITIAIGLLFAIWLFRSMRRRKMFIENFQEKCVFITGTDSGFGKNLALALDKKGVKVYAGCYTENGLNSLTDQSSDKMKCIRIDITDEKSILAAREVIEADLVANHQGLWGLVNNAGLGKGAIFHLSNVEDYKMCMDVNLFGTIRTTEIFLPLIKTSKGRIVNVISIVRRFPIMVEPYASSKVALAVYNDGLRRYMKDYGIRVAGIEPGAFQTDMTTTSTAFKDIDNSWQHLPENLKKEFGNKFPEAVKMDLTLLLTKRPLAWYNHTDAICDAMTNALFSMNPKSSYICGMDANLFYRFGLYFPDFIGDSIARLLFSNAIRALKFNLKT